MRILIQFPFGFERFGHALAVVLKEQYGIDEFLAFTYRNYIDSRFLRQQSDLQYKQILSESDLYQSGKNEKLNFAELKRIESKYGMPTLWPFVIADRWLYFKRSAYLYQNGSSFSYEAIMGHIQHRFRRIEKIIQDFRPDHVIFAGDDIGQPSAYILWRVASKLGIPISVLWSTRVRNLFTVVDNFSENMIEINRRYKEICDGSFSVEQANAVQFLDEFRSKGIYPEYWIDVPSGNPIFDWIEGLRRLPQLPIRMVRALVESYWQDPYFLNPIARLKDIAIIQARKIYSFLSHLFEESIDGEAFVYYPLHTEPELGINIITPFQTDQITLIENVAKSLPVGIRLYVKEHRWMIGKRDIKFYKRLKCIPSVRLIHPEEDSLTLIKHSKGVITVNGTAGWEAILMSKPVITFGNPLYHVLDFVYLVKDEKMISGIISQLDQHVADDKKLVAFLCAIFEKSIPLDITRLKKFTVQSLIEDSQFQNYIRLMVQRMGIEISTPALANVH